MYYFANLFPYSETVVIIIETMLLEGPVKADNGFKPLLINDEPAALNSTRSNSRSIR